MCIEYALELLKSGNKLTSSKFNQPDFEFIEYDATFINPVRFIKRCGYNEPYDLKEDNDYRLVAIKTTNHCCIDLIQFK